MNAAAPDPTAPSSVAMAQAIRVPVRREYWFAFFTLIYSKGHKGKGDPATRAERKLRYHERHPEIRRNYYLRNAERIKEQTRRWKEANPARYAELRRRFEQSPKGQRHRLLKNLNLTTNASNELVRACITNRNLREELRHECR